MSRLEQRIARLEQKRKRPDTTRPTWEQMYAAEQRRLARTKARLTGAYPEGDTPEQAAKDVDIMRRWNRAEGISEEDLAVIAEQTREKLRNVGGGRAA